MLHPSILLVICLFVAWVPHVATLSAPTRRIRKSPKRSKETSEVPGKTKRQNNPHGRPTLLKGSNYSKRLPVPSLKAQLEYVRNGHTVMRNVLDPDLLSNLRTRLWRHGKDQELKAWQQKVEVAADSPTLAASCKSIKACRAELKKLNVPADSLPFLQYFHTAREIPQILRLAESLAEIAAVLMDVPSVRLYQDALFWKRPADGATPWHVDARMAPFDTSHMVTLWIPLQHVPEDGTALLFCSKSHADFALPYWSPYDQSMDEPNSAWNRLEERYGDPNRSGSNDDPLSMHYMPLSVGDITAHSGWTLHCANVNESEEDHRLALAISYVDARAPVRSAKSSVKGDSEDTWSYQDWLPEVPADTADWNHPLVPIVWPPEKFPKKKQNKQR